MTEFDIIKKYFKREVSDGILGVGDDCAIIANENWNTQLAITMDTLVAGTHFLEQDNPSCVGHKALAVNLSDLAAMGAKPKWVFLALTLPSVDENWLTLFSQGFWNIANEYSVDLLGGDTTKGPMAVTITAIGEIENGKILRRDGAKLGDDIWVSGAIGGAGLASVKRRGAQFLESFELKCCNQALQMPTPRVGLGEALVGIANSAIDISDGLISEIEHVVSSSGVGANIDYTVVPCFSEIEELKHEEKFRSIILTGGEDYELLFTANPEMAERIVSIEAEENISLTKIGKIVAGGNVLVRGLNGDPIHLEKRGYDHFGT